MSEIVDHHTIYAFVGYCTPKQVNETIDKCISQLPPDNYDTRRMVNVVYHSKDGKPLKHAYIYFPDSRIRNALVGLNLDGTKRIRYDTKDFVVENGKDWADLDEEDNAVKILDPPLVEVPAVFYDEEQMKQMKSRDDTYEYDHEEGYTIEFMECKAKVPDEDEEINCNVITGRIPRWVTGQMLLNRFAPFNHSQRKYIRRANGREIIGNYPDVAVYERDNKRGETEYFFSITFDPDTHDALFALFFARKFCFVNPKGKEEVTVSGSFQRKKVRRN